MFVIFLFKEMFCFTDDNTVVVAGVAAAAAVAGIGLTALIASLLEKKV